MLVALNCLVAHECVADNASHSMAKKEKPSKAKKAILRISTEEFAAKGFNGARIEVIASRAKVNQAMLYYHYGCKDKLYARAIQSLAESEFGDAWPKFPDTWNLSDVEELYLVMYYFTRYQLTIVDPLFSRLLAWDLAENNHILKRVIQDYFIPLMEQFVGFLEKGVAAGEYAVTEPHLFVHNFFSTLAWYKLNRNSLEGTEIFEKLYEKEAVERFAVFFVSHSLRALSPPEKVLNPTIAPEYLNHVQAMLKAKAIEKATHREANE